MTSRGEGKARAGAGLGLAALFALAAMLAPPRASAEPSRAPGGATIWARAREPGRAQRAALVARAEKLIFMSKRARRAPEDPRAALALFHLREARALLEQARAAASPLPLERFRYAQVLHDLGMPKEAAGVLEGALALPAAPPHRSEMLTELAICYARLGRHGDEIEAYGRALAIEPDARARALILANRAEAQMATGDLEGAIAGYRASLAHLSTLELFDGGPTTLWGLAVATDRSGDPEQALSLVELARSYDPEDRRISGPGWFYVPPYDEAYYKALGHWSKARRASGAAAKEEAYGLAIAAWEDFLARAAPDDRWLPVARARKRRCEAELERASEAARAARKSRARSSGAPEREDDEDD